MNVPGKNPAIDKKTILVISMVFLFDNLTPRLCHEYINDNGVITCKKKLFLSFRTV
jgi:hypothetical protein